MRQSQSIVPFTQHPNMLRMAEAALCMRADQGEYFEPVRECANETISFSEAEGLTFNAFLNLREIQR